MDEGINLEQWLADADELQRLAGELNEDGYTAEASQLDDEGDLLRTRALIMRAAMDGDAKVRALREVDTQLDFLGVL